MKIKTKKLSSGRWFDWKDTRLFIRPFANIEGIVNPQGAMSRKEMADAGWNLFNFCLVDWEIINCKCDDSVPTSACHCTEKLPCNEENKLEFFSYMDELILFVNNANLELRLELHEQLKN